MDNPPTHRGRLKIFLGYAAGVGKTFRMLEEGHDLVRQGADAVIGYSNPTAARIQLTGRAGWRSYLRQRSSGYPRAFLRGNGHRCDPCARPRNMPGGRTRPYQCSWIRAPEALGRCDGSPGRGDRRPSTLNIQHLESLNDYVSPGVTGIRVRETLPDWIITQADEVVMVDVTVEALLNRLRRGAVYEQAKARRALENFFKESTLVALRELALRQTAHQVELHQEEESEAPASRLPLSDRPLSMRTPNQGRGFWST